DRLNCLGMDVDRQLVPDALGMMGRCIHRFAVAAHTRTFELSPISIWRAEPVTSALAPTTEWSITTPSTVAPSETMLSDTTQPRRLAPAPTLAYGPTTDPEMSA